MCTLPGDASSFSAPDVVDLGFLSQLPDLGLFLTREGIDLSSLYTAMHQPFPNAAHDSTTASSGTRYPQASTIDQTGARLDAAHPRMAIARDSETKQVLPFPHVPLQVHASIPVGSRFARANYLSLATEMPLLLSSLWAPDIHISSPPVVASIPPQGDIEDTDTEGMQDLERVPSHVSTSDDGDRDPPYHGECCGSRSMYTWRSCQNGVQ
jgi:hypothetical protein